MGRREAKQGIRLTGAEHDEIHRRVQAGESYTIAAAAIGCSTRSIQRLLARGRRAKRRPRERSAHRLSCAEREEISRRLLVGDSFRQIAKRLGRAPSTVSREVHANGRRATYRAWSAEQSAAHRNLRPRTSKLAAHPTLRKEVERRLKERWSPQQIAARLVLDYSDDLTMRISHETIYQSLFIQARGALRKELTTCLRTGRARRRPHGRTDLQGRLPDMVMISDRPAEAVDRAVPGHWEGDLIIGKGGKSAIATLVERTSRYLVLVHLPDGRRAEQVRSALTREVIRLPTQLRKTLTWDQGKEMAGHAKFTIDTNVSVFFCDPHAPWQRGSNENTNGLLRQYFPKASDLSPHTQADLNAVARELNARPRQTLQWMKPCEIFNAVASTV
jgi:IS30 family transposase